MKGLLRRRVVSAIDQGDDVFSAIWVFQDGQDFNARSVPSCTPQVTRGNPKSSLGACATMRAHAGMETSGGSGAKRCGISGVEAGSRGLMTIRLPVLRCGAVRRPRGLSRCWRYPCSGLVGRKGSIRDARKNCSKPRKGYGAITRRASLPQVRVVPVR